jgi:hypothetical protein
MDNCDGPDEFAGVARIARDVTQDEDARCSAIRTLSGIILNVEADKKDVSEAIRICAGIVKDQPRPVQDAAMQSLDQTIRSRAKIAVKGARSTMAIDFVEMSTGLIFERIVAGKYNPEISGTFQGWCYKVLKRKWISEIRERKTDATGHMETGRPGDHISEDANDLIEDGRLIHEHSIDLRTLRDRRFESEDMESLRAWKSQNRVLLLSLSGLWAKVPPDDWRQWLDEVKIAIPFPPETFGSLPTDQERFKIMAEALLRINPAANEENVKQKWYRKAPSLANLNLFRGLK